MQKTKLKYVLYHNRINSPNGKIVDSGTTSRPMTAKDLVKEMNETYGNSKHPFKYDGRCGLYTIYKTSVDSTGRYYVLHIERSIIVK